MCNDLLRTLERISLLVATIEGESDLERELAASLTHAGERLAPLGHAGRGDAERGGRPEV